MLNAVPEIPGEMEELAALASTAFLGLDLAGLGVWVWTVSGTRAWFSPQWAEMLGYDAGDLRQAVTDWDRYILPSEQVAAHEAMSAYLAGTVDAYALTLRAQARDGSVRWVEDRARIVQRHEDGRALRLVGVRRDITAQIRLETALAENLRSAETQIRNRTSSLQILARFKEQSTTELEALLDGLPMAVGLLDRDLRYQRLNRRMAAIHGLTARDCLGQSLEILAPGALAPLADATRRVLATGETLAAVEIQLDAQGEAAGRSTWVASLWPVSNGDREVGLMLQEVTQWQQKLGERERILAQERDLRRTLEASLAETELLGATLSHDLRAPLRAIEGYADILASDCSAMNEEQEHILQRLRANAHRITVMTEAVLDHVRTLHRPLAIDRLRMVELFGSVWETLRRTIGDRAPELVINELPECSGDGVQVRQVWENLLSNAVKYSVPRDRPRIEVGGSCQDGKCTYYVRDNGVGFDAARVGELFRPFKRLHEGSKFEGTGLGLVSARRIVERHGGRIWAESQAHGGATFYFTLPGN